MKVVLVDNLILPEAGSVAEMDVHPRLGLLALAAAAEGDGQILRSIPQSPRSLGCSTARGRRRPSWRASDSRSTAAEARRRISPISPRWD
jgi:hypothetical protein